jgi:hypothetical protein
MKRICLQLLFLTLALSSYSQGNIIKVNLTSFVFKDVYVSYERTFLKRFSLNLGVDYMPTRNIPFASNFGDVNGYPNPAIGMTVSGWRITPEVRIYMSLTKGSPKGFYIAPYFRYGNYDFQHDAYQYHYNDVYDNNIAKTAKVDFTGKYAAVGGGIMIGHQWIIAKRLSLDFWILGLGVSSVDFDLRASSNDMDKRYFSESSSFSHDVESNLRVFNNISLTTGDNFVQANSNNVFLGVRGLGFNVGFAF